MASSNPKDTTTTTTRQPTQRSEIGADLTAFLRSLDPATTLLDISAIESAAVVPEGLGQHGGLSGSMARIALTYAPSAAIGGHRPATIICKSNHDSDQSRAHARAMQLPREALFLRAIQTLQVANARGGGATPASVSKLVSLMQHHAPTLVGGLPAIYYAAGDMSAGTKLVLCEDLSLPREVTVPGDKGAVVSAVGIQSGWLLGPHSILNRGMADLDKIVRSKGWRVDGDEAEPEKPCVPVSTKELVTRSFLAAAELHGAFWGKGAEILTSGSEQDGPNEASSYLRGAKWFLSTQAGSGPADAHFAHGKALYDGSMHLAHANWAGYKTRLAKHAEEAAAAGTPVKYAIPANVASLMDACYPASGAHPPYEQFLEAFGKRPHTLVHGDFHPGNMVVCGAEGAAAANGDALYRIALIDWEVVGIGSGPQDIGQYMISHFTREQFEALALPAVEAYAQKLMGVISSSSGSSTRKAEDADNAERQLRATIMLEVVVGALGRWAWLLGIMGGMESISLAAMAYFNEQVDACMAWAMRSDVADVLGTPRGADELAQLVGIARP